MPVIPAPERLRQEDHDFELTRPIYGSPVSKANKHTWTNDNSLWEQDFRKKTAS